MRAACFPAQSLEPQKIDRITTRHPTESPLERLYSLISCVWPKEGDVAGIAVATPGPTDPYAGVLMEAPNIPGWEHLPIRKHLEDHFNAPIAIGNDANLAAMGEWKYGAGQGHHDLLYITVSTGIGGGVIMRDQLLLGSHGLAAELGHITVLPDGPVCSCGYRGHLESLSAGPAIASWVESEIKKGMPSCLPADKPLTAKLVAEAAAAGDELATAGLARSGFYLGLALANFLHSFNPTIIIIGGGVSRSGKFIMEPLQASLREHALPHYLEDLTITTASLADNAGLMGALALARTLKS